MGMAPELRRYRSIKDMRWFVFDPETGWVIFPAEGGGWQKRQPSSGINNTDMREVSLSHGIQYGNPERALTETARMRAAEGDPGWLERCREEEASFVPYIHVQGERSVPSGITVFGLTGGHARWTTFHVPGVILQLPLDEQLAALPESVVRVRLALEPPTNTPQPR